MNLPIGEVVSQGINLKEVDGRRLVETFYDKNFSGYLVSTIEGFDGLEEGILLFKEGALAAAFYEYDFYGITVFGDSAVPQVFNSFAAKNVVADVVSLSNQQVDLVTAFNDRGKLSKPLQKGEVSRFVVKYFSPDFAKKTLSEVVKESESKKDIFKKLGLEGLSEH